MITYTGVIKTGGMLIQTFYMISLNMADLLIVIDNLMKCKVQYNSLAYYCFTVLVCSL